MLKKFLKPFLLICSIILTSCHFQDIKNFTSFEQELASIIKSIKVFDVAIKDNVVDENTLILIDIDNTILRPKGHYGSTEYFYHLVKDEVVLNNVSEKEAILNIFDRYAKSQDLIENKLIDNKIHDFVDYAKSKNATIIAFTARSSRLITEVTYNQLKKHNIEFDKLEGFNFSKNYQHEITMKEGSKKKILFDSYSIFYKGILFANHFNSKGDVLKSFYRKLSAYREAKSLSKITKVVFFDDMMYNVDSIKQATKDLGLHYYGYHIDIIHDYDHNMAREEEKEILSKISSNLKAS